MSDGGILQHLADAKKGIRENFEQQYFEFYVAGYTKTCRGQHVQQYHAQLYQDAQTIINKPDEKGQYIFPFGFRDPCTRARLVPEPNNQYDPDAIIVVVDHPFHIEKFLNGENNKVTELVLGYVPKHISRVVRHNLDKLGDGWVKKVRQIHGKKHCATKIAIPWIVEASEEDLVFLDRLANVVNVLE